MVYQYVSDSETCTHTLGQMLGTLVQAGDVLCLNGDLGAGKTKFAQGVGCGLEIEEAITSPTFTLINEYQGRLPYYHMDVYRLEGVEEMYDIGYEEYFESAGVVLIEWANQVAEILPEERLEIEIQRGEQEEERIITLKPRGVRYNQLVEELRFIVGIRN